MMQDCASSNKIKENKYKILRMSLLLGSDDNREETITNFEDSAREIDSMNDEVYLKNLEDKFYDTSSLEEEEKKLSVLVDYIGGRVEQRISLLTDFSNITGYDLQNLPPIQYYDKLDDYKERLKYIREYLTNVGRLDVLSNEIQKASDELDKAYKNKAAAEEFNLRNEDIVLKKFEHIVSSLDYFKDINDGNIDEYLSNVIGQVSDSKKSLDIFTKSFTTLSGSGISLEEEEEYRSYVINAQDVYYFHKEQEYLIRIYQYLIHKESDYNAILVKRESINDLLYERLDLRKKLNITDVDVLNSIYDLFEKQYEDINKQKNNIDRIEELNSLIQVKKSEMNDLEVDNQKVEILALLREFGIIDTYSNIVDEKVDDLSIDSSLSLDNKEDVILDLENSKTSDAEMISDSVDSLSVTDSLTNDDNYVDDDSLGNNSDDIVASKVEEEVLDNQVVSVDSTDLIDFDLVHSKANKVMQRVGEMLGIKVKEDTVVSVVSDDVKSVPLDKENISNKDANVVVESNNVSLDSNGNSENESINPMFQSVSQSEANDSNSTLGDNFWFPSETPDALNELPDLNVSQNIDSNNFFANNSMPDLNFPDLKVDFGHGNSEVQE